MRKVFNLQNSLFCQWPDHPYTKELEAVDRILDENVEVLSWIKKDLQAGQSPHNTGATGMTVEQIFRAAILKQQNTWTYEFLAVQLADSDMTRAFVKLDFGEIYRKSCLQDNISKIRGETWQRFNDQLAVWAKEEKYEDGRTVRMDATNIETNIHRPSDSTLLYDGIRVVSDALKAIRKAGGPKFYSPVKALKAKKKMLKIKDARGEDERKPIYKSLIADAQKVQEYLSKILVKLEKYILDSSLFLRQYNRLSGISDYFPLVIDQSKRRVLRGESLRPEEKVISLFEPHSDILVKGKREVEYGHKVFFTSGRSGLITDCQLVQGNPNDKDWFLDLVERQTAIYGRAPRQTSTDGGFASEDNVDEAKELGVKDVCFSKSCGLSVEEMCKSEWVFLKLRNFRAGIEGNISALKRAFGLSRVTWKGLSGFASYVHSAVVSYNLMLLAKIRTG